MRGVTRIVWKDLHPAIFEYKANCDIDGNLVADKKVVKKMLEINQGGSNHAVDCESLEKEIDDELENGIDPTAARFSQKNPIQKVQKDPVDWTTGQYVLQTTLLAKLKTYERMGYIFVVIGVIMNMPWIVGLQLMSQNIEYMG